MEQWTCTMEALEIRWWEKMDLSFYRGKKVLITGHTGFKGTWMCMILSEAGAEVSGYALEPVAGESVYTLCHMDDRVNSVIGDIRDYEKLSAVFKKVQPQIVIHMAAQPLVRESYARPRYTYDVNVMGTVNVLECIRQNECVRSFVNVTTDKVYLNKEWNWGYRENEELNGYDPYSNSKSCSELVTSSYTNSFFQKRDIAVSTMRAGNVIGGGDFAKDRIIPDCIRAATAGEKIEVRNPNSVRPYQHVLEPVMAYLMVAQKQYEDRAYAGNYNVGPEEASCVTTGELATLFCDTWNRYPGQKVTWETKNENGPHEANYLKLDCSRIKTVFGWKQKWTIQETMDKIVSWTKAHSDGADVAECMKQQILEYMREANV